MISIIDYGIGNLGSVLNMFRKVKAEAQITSDLKTIEQARKILLPGVGAFDRAMQKIHDAGMFDLLNYKALEEKIPILGVCLGMQLLMENSEEGALPGFGWIPGHTVAFKKTGDLKVPHMGWNEVEICQPCPLVTDLPEEPRFYFVHSYYVTCDDDRHVLLQASYGLDFAAAVWKDNIYGAQFHPEKSHKYGMKLFDNFNRLI